MHKTSDGYSLQCELWYTESNDYKASLNSWNLKILTVYKHTVPVQQKFWEPHLPLPKPGEDSRLPCSTRPAPASLLVKAGGFWTRVLGWPVCLDCGLRTPFISRSAVKLKIEGLSSSPGPLSTLGMAWRRWALLGFLQIRIVNTQLWNDHGIRNEHDDTRMSKRNYAVHLGKMGRVVKTWDCWQCWHCNLSPVSVSRCKSARAAAGCLRSLYEEVPTSVQACGHMWVGLSFKQSSLWWMSPSWLSEQPLYSGKRTQAHGDGDNSLTHLVLKYTMWQRPLTTTYGKRAF